jgi:transposase
MPATIAKKLSSLWREVETFDVKNDVDSFQRLDRAIRSHIKVVNEVAIAVDHTGGHYSEPLVNFLQAKGYTVYHLETKAVKAARERLLDQESKSDTIDAISSAYLLYLRDAHGISFRISALMPELGSSASLLKSLVLQRTQFSKLASQATNRLHQYLLAVFPEGEAQYFHQLLRITYRYPTPRDIIASRGFKMVASISDKDKTSILELAHNTVGIPGETYRWLIQDLSLQRLEYLQKQDVLTKIIRKQVAQHPYGDILLSFPHLGEIGAATLIGVVQDITRYSDKKKFKKILGVYARQTQSGGSPSRASQGKEGSRDGRRVLFQVCFGCIRKKVRDSDFRDYYRRQVVRGKPRMKALVATMGKLAEIIYHCLKTGEPYEYQGKYKVLEKKDRVGAYTSDQDLSVVSARAN